MTINYKEINASTGMINNLPNQIMQQVISNYSFRPDNYMFNPKYKSGLWNGWIRPILRNGNNIQFPTGLYPEIKDYIEKHTEIRIEQEHYSYDKAPIEINQNAIDNLPFEPYDYQLYTVKTALNNNRQLILSPTGSGKSLIIYLILQSVIQHIHNKVLLLVPTVGLVTQMYNDFKSYCKDDDILMDNIHCISAGKEKNADVGIYISTWQSIYKQDDDYFKQFDCLIVDEVHKAESNSITNICNKSINAHYRFGLTGTLKETKLNEIMLKGHFGSVCECVNTKQLMEMGILTNLKVHHVQFKHTEKMPRLNYHDELDYINLNEKRQKLLALLTANVAETGNTLLLVNFVEKQGDVQFELLNKLTQHEKYSNRKVYYINGNTPANEREQIRQDIEHLRHGIIIATYQVFQEGINIRNLHNIIFGSPTKSIVRTLQSVGRGLRLHESKDYCYLYDVYDTLNLHGELVSYSEKHHISRVSFYKEIVTEQLETVYEI